jgi:hypothetical protein
VLQPALGSLLEAGRDLVTQLHGLLLTHGLALLCHRLGTCPRCLASCHSSTALLFQLCLQGWASRVG